MEQEFSTILKERLEKNRKDSSECLSNYTHALICCYFNTEESKTLKEMLDNIADIIIADCEIFHNMDESKAIDAMKELTHLATVYYPEQNRIYRKVCSKIDKIRASYPVKDILETIQK